MPSQQRKTPAWKDFELSVAELLGVQGYDVRSDRLHGSQQSDSIATIQYGLITATVLVECKYSERDKRVGVEQVANFIGRVGAARIAGGIDRGFLVTNTGFTRTAIDAVHTLNAQSFVSLMTYEEMVGSLLDFRPYLRRLASDYAASAIAQYYVDLPCEAITNSVMTQDLGSRTRRKSTLAFVRRWMATADSSQLCVLGDYGTGKTSLCRYLAKELAEAYLLNPSKRRIPLLIPLSQYVNAGGARPMITDWMINSCGVVNARYDAFRRMLETGRFVLLLDGFDEMTMRTDAETIRRNFRDILELYAIEGKLVVTGRPAYFSDLDEFNRAVGAVGGAGKVFDEIYRQYFKLEPFTVVEILPLGPKEITTIVRARADEIQDAGRSPDALLSLIWETYDLEDLATRPVLLDIIVRTYCAIGSDIAASNAAALYQAYVDLWIELDRSKGEFRRLMTSDDKKFFMEELAWMMYATKTESVHYSQLPVEIARRFDLPAAAEQDFFAHDVMTSSFLNRDDLGYYRFMHKSFQEFFVARKIYDELEAGHGEVIESVVLSDEVLDFIADLSASEMLFAGLLREALERAQLNVKRDTSVLESGSYGRAVVVGACNAVGLLLRSGERRIPWARLYLAGLKIPADIDLTAITEKGKLVEAIWREVDMRSVELSQLRVERADWGRVSAVGVTADESSWSDCTFVSCSFQAARLSGSRFRNVDFRDCSFEGADLSNSRFSSCNGMGLRFSGSNLTNAVFDPGCDLTNADFTGADTTGAKFRDVKTAGALFDRGVAARLGLEIGPHQGDR